MDVHLLSPCTVLALPWQANPGEFRMTFVARVTCDLVDGGEARIAEEQDHPSGDEGYADGEEGAGSLRRASDAAFFKPRADVLLTGSAHAPGGRPVPMVRAGLRVGSLSKTVAVVGRRWLGGRPGVVLRMPDPEPFVEMPLRYENAFGGDGCDANPVGKGRDGRELPNLEIPGSFVTDLKADAEPACFAPLRPGWSPRSGMVGTYKGDWFEKRWPCFPPDFDWGWFNAAPRDQQVEGYLRGDEALVLENLHPEIPRFECRLPGIRMRVFIEAGGAGDPEATEFIEVPANLDTLAIDMDAGRIGLVWRAVADIRSDEGEEIVNLVLGSEPMSSAPASPAGFEQRFREHLEKGDPDEEEFEVFELGDGGPDIDDDEEIARLEAEIARAEAEMRQAIKRADLDPDKVIAEGQRAAEKELRGVAAKHGLDAAFVYPLTRADLDRQLAAGESLAGQNLGGLDLGGLDFKGVDLSEADLTGASIEGAVFDGADLRGANLGGARASGSRWIKAQLDDADLTGAVFSKAEFDEVSLAGTMAEQADFEEARFTGCLAREAIFAEGRFGGASFERCDLSVADFSEAALERAVMRDCQLDEASLVGVRAEGLDVTGCTLEKLRASEGACFRGASFTECRGRETCWDGSDLSDARLAFSDLQGGLFEKSILAGADLEGADLGNAMMKKADLRGAALRDANLFLAGMQGADLRGADLRGANLFGVDFLDARLDDCKLEGANLRRTTLAP
jgi:uncharacterized protein YjbI with pentapeptide repeats